MYQLINVRQLNITTTKMTFLYNFSILAYTTLVKFAALFNPKAKLWVNGRKNQWQKINQMFCNNNAPVAWFHVSSLGEFEQGRPVIEAFKKQNPGYKIALSFFSPSGYEIRKNYPNADFIFYLPVDNKKNAKKLINTIKPKIAYFVKYDYWYHYLKTLKANNINTYIFSSIFRPQQLFFKPYGKWYKNLLKYFTHIFVQDNESLVLLSKINITNVTVAGDTRYDRVVEITKNAANLPIVENFAKNNTVIVAGSTWDKDEALLLEYINLNKGKIKLIIAPHEIHEKNIQRIEKSIKLPYIKYSQANTQNVLNAQILLIDSIGLLASVYRYGKFAYIGGGFGVGIHNTLEAATYGLPVVFGPNYKRFNEACQLISLNAAFSINNFNNLKNIFDTLITDSKFCTLSGDKSRGLVEKMCGGTQIIIDKTLP